MWTRPDPSDRRYLRRHLHAGIRRDVRQSIDDLRDAIHQGHPWEGSMGMHGGFPHHDPHDHPAHPGIDDAHAEIRHMRGGFPHAFPGDGPRGWRGRGGGRGGRSRQRGDIRTALLALLAEADGHGYDLIRRLDERSGGTWHPSPGSVYPTLQLLEDEGLVRSVEGDGKRVYELTDEGHAEASRRVEAAGGPPWERAGQEGEGIGELRDAVMQLGAAARQLAAGGSDEQITQATAIVTEARKQVYRMLAED